MSKKLEEKVVELKHNATELAKQIPQSYLPQIVEKLGNIIQIDIQKNLDDKEFEKYEAAIFNIEYFQMIEKELRLNLWLSGLELQNISKDLVQKLIVILEPSHKNFTSLVIDVHQQEVNQYRDIVRKYQQYDDLVAALEIFVTNKNYWWKSQCNTNELQTIEAFMQKIKNNMLDKTVDEMEEFEIVASKKMIEFLTDCLRDTTYWGRILPFLKELFENENSSNWVKESNRQ